MHLLSEPSFHHFKNRCICCEESNKEMNREHIFPQWLLKMTNTEQDLFSSPYGKVPGKTYTIPLCKECNSKLGSELEVPVSKIFRSIESGNGFNDFDAELLARWIWKINGMYYWSFCNENWKYGYITLKEHVLSRIVQPRNRISIAISLVEDSIEDFGCAPVGMDAVPFYSNVYGVGVFSKICLVVFLSEFSHYFDERIWTVYRLSNSPMVLNPNIKIFPKIGFKTGGEAISFIKLFYGNDSRIYRDHEVVALTQKAKISQQQIRYK